MLVDLAVLLVDIGNIHAPHNFPEVSPEKWRSATFIMEKWFVSRNPMLAANSDLMSFCRLVWQTSK